MINSNNPFSLIGKTILITGASSGIGQGIAIACSRQGAKVLLLGRDLKRLNDTLARCENGKDHAGLSLDFQDTDGWTDEFTSFAKENAPIHGFVHAAGISPTVPFKIIKAEQIQETFQLNVFSAIEILQIISKVGIKSPEGMSMVMISSVMSEVGQKGKSLYAMTKAALVALVKSLALEYADKNIRFNAISPSVVNTPLSGKSEYRKDPAAMKQVEDMHPLGLGEVEDVAHAAIYLLADASRWVTGTNMVVDGGYLSS
ncbi:SDR family NAD(P)-dependent oxidoreductase [Cyclobacterium sp. SYSU L10401]|uniref:SDR family NAD(P)-dependent oxidoreductase n=1 Tax=Cyclobacterium sp. SYSU L10401 TaxID=2678657 RepID=UPI0013D55783|nr:SDR family oxidoreductase [Cyclobacterium sp. SYSU L10401]